MFAKILVDTYLRTKKLDYLNEAISVSRDICKNCPPQTTGRTMGTRTLILLLGHAVASSPSQAGLG
jgi:hypothetical protein